MRYATIIAALAAAAPSLAQCTPSATNFCVTIELKTANHPIQTGWFEAYYINGVEAMVVTLERGKTYTFQMDNVDPFHPFYISTSMQGAGLGIYSQGVSPTFVSGTETMTFAVPASAPATLWYQCLNHSGMGYRIDIIDPPASCYANCDGSTGTPQLNVADFGCFLTKFAAGDPYANCDGSTGSPQLNVADFGCFLTKFAAGCN